MTNRENRVPRNDHGGLRQSARHLGMISRCRLRDIQLSQPWPVKGQLAQRCETNNAKRPYLRELSAQPLQQMRGKGRAGSLQTLFYGSQVHRHDVDATAQGRVGPRQPASLVGRYALQLQCCPWPVAQRARLRAVRNLTLTSCRALAGSTGWPLGALVPDTHVIDGCAGGTV